MSAWGLARQRGAVGHHSATRLAWEWLETRDGMNLPAQERRHVRQLLSELDDALHELDAKVFLDALSTEAALQRPTPEQFNRAAMAAFLGTPRTSQDDPGCPPPESSRAE